MEWIILFGIVIVVLMLVGVHLRVDAMQESLDELKECIPAVGPPITRRGRSIF